MVDPLYMELVKHVPTDGPLEGERCTAANSSRLGRCRNKYEYEMDDGRKLCYTHLHKEE